MVSEPLKVKSAAVSDRGLSEKRPQNEDSYLEMASSGIFAVADGVGGAQAGEVASQMAMEIVGEAFANFRAGADAETVMRTAFERANTAIFQMARDLPQLTNMATTVVALHLEGNIATIGHVGDSRLYRVDADGSLFRETDDHSVVADEVRAGRMTEEQAENHPSRNIINRALGAESRVEIDLKTILVDPGNAFLICSDGITRHVTDAEIKGVLNLGGGPQEICDYLKDLCFERGAEDNLTAVVISISGNGGTPVKRSASELLEIEEPTIATSKLAETQPKPVDEDDNFLELETRPLVPVYVPHSLEDSIATAEIEDQTQLIEDEPKNQRLEVHIPEESPGPRRTLTVPGSQRADDFSIFRESLPPDEPEAASPLKRLATAAGLMILGGVIGFLAYHFAVSPPLSAQMPDNSLTQMSTENIGLTAFENTRRTVDAEPAMYLQNVAPTDSPEDYYLRGRAFLLTGDLPQARAAFVEAQKRLSQAEPANLKTLATDLVIGLRVVNYATAADRLTADIGASLAPSPATTPGP